MTEPTTCTVPVEFLRGVIALCTQRGYSPENIEAWSKDDKWVADLWRQAEQMLAIAKWGTPAPVGVEPVANLTVQEGKIAFAAIILPDGLYDLYTAPQPVGRVPLTKREVELLDGMIAVQLDHADRCDSVPNRTMADRQKGWDMERVALLKKIKQGGQHGTE